MTAIRKGLACTLRELAGLTDPVERHFSLQAMVAETYRLRSDHPEMRTVCKGVALQHLAEFKTIAEALRAKLGSVPMVRAFRLLATLLAEDLCFDGAIRVCEPAISFGVRDEFAMGFEGRIAGPGGADEP